MRKLGTDHGFAFVYQLMENHRAYGQPESMSSGSPKDGIKYGGLSFPYPETVTEESHGQPLKVLKIRGTAMGVRFPGSSQRYETSEHFITDSGQRRIPCPDRFAVGGGQR